MNRKKQKKEYILPYKVLVLIIFIVILGGRLMVLPGKASASEKTSSKVTTTLKNGIFTVRGKGKMPESARPASFQKKKIKKIVIKNGIVSLPEKAFKNCKKAASINIAASVKEIGMQAFANTSIKSITIPKTVKRIGWGICLGCDLLETMVIPGTFDVLEPSNDNWLEPFVAGKKSLGTVKFSTALNPELVRMAGDCMNFEVLPSDPGFTSIDGIIYTKDCKTLVRIPYARSEAVIADGCEIVATGSFTYTADGYHEPHIYSGCGALKSIVFPASVKTITDRVYSKSARSGEDTRDGSIQLNMASLDITSAKKLWKYCNWKKSLADELARISCATVIDGMVILKDGYLCGYIGDGDKKEVIVPDSVKTIGKSAFGAGSKYGLSSVVLGNNVELIEDYAFSFNKKIKVYIKSKNIKISDKAFSNCDTYELIIK